MLTRSNLTDRACAGGGKKHGSRCLDRGRRGFLGLGVMMSHLRNEEEGERWTIQRVLLGHLALKECAFCTFIGPLASQIYRKVTV